MAKGKFRPNFQVSFSKILTNKEHHVKVQAVWFHLNGHIIGFRPQTQKLESPYKTPSNTLAVKGLTEYFGKTTAQECKKTLPVDVRRSKTPLLVSSLLANFSPCR